MHDNVGNQKLPRIEESTIMWKGGTSSETGEYKMKLVTFIQYTSITRAGRKIMFS